MEGEEKRGLSTWLVGSLELEKELEKRYKSAYETAERAGKLVGRISRYWEIVSGPGERVKIEVDPDTYFQGGQGPIHRIGDYLVAVDPKSRRLVLLRTTRIYRSDMLAAIGIEPPVSTMSNGSPIVDPVGAATLTIVEAEPLLEADEDLSEPPVPAVTSLEPQSPVVDPNPEVLEALLSLPKEGVILGSLAGPWGLVKHGSVPVRLPYKALLQHVLIVGTTGSGKTTLLKNSIASIYSGWNRKSMERPLVLVLDLNEDYVQVPFQPASHSLARLRDDPVYQKVYRGVKPPSGELIVLPTSRDLLVSVAEASMWSSGVGELLSLLVEWYRRRVLEPLVPEEGSRGEWGRVRSSGGSFFFQGVHGGVPILLAPYAVETFRLPSEAFLGLLPGMSQLARDLIRRVRERFRRRNSVYPPVNILAAGLLHYQVSQGYKQDRGMDPGAEAALEMLASSIVSPGEAAPEKAASSASMRFGGEKHKLSPLEAAIEISKITSKLVPHEGTLKAALRRLQSAVDTGLLDVMIYDAEDNSVVTLPEPGPGELVERAESLGVPIIVDLKPASESGAGGVEGPRLIAYRILQGLAWWKQRLYASRRMSRMILLIIDEAHQFFPQEKGPREEQEANRQVAAMIARVARLGRARGLGLVFATHSPRDLHDIIIQLSNTKIVLRAERSQLDRLEIDPTLREYIPRLPDRMMLVQSHVYRQHGVMVQTSPPLTLHYDVSALLH